MAPMPFQFRLSWLWLLLLQLMDIVIFQGGAEASQYCSAYRDSWGTYRSGFWCSYYCCGTSRNKYCCSTRSYAISHESSGVGAIVGGILSMLIIGGIIALVVCCCVSACPLYQSRYRGRVVGWWRGAPVTTTIHTGPTVVATTNTQMQPVQYGGGYPMQQRPPYQQQRGVAAPMGAPYQQHHAYPQHGYAQPPPAYQTQYPSQQQYPGPPQYPPPGGVQYPPRAQQPPPGGAQQPPPPAAVTPASTTTTHMRQVTH